MAQYRESQNAGFVMAPNGQLVPRDSVDPSDIAPLYDTSTPTAADVAGNAPTVDRTTVDQIQSKLDAARNVLTQLGNSQRQFSLAGAQTSAALGNNDLASLGASRQAPPRVAAATEARALNTAAGNAAQITNQGALNRSDEEDADKRLRLQALDAAGKLGLNQAGLEFNIQKANMAAATDYINNLFTENRLKVALNENQAARVMQYAQSKILLQYDYDKMDSNERIETDRLLTKKYGIDKDVEVELEKIDHSNDFSWQGFLQGAIGAGTQVGAKYIGAGGLAGDSGVGQETGQAEGTAATNAGNQNFTGLNQLSSGYDPNGFGYGDSH